MAGGRSWFAGQRVGGSGGQKRGRGFGLLGCGLERGGIGRGRLPALAIAWTVDEFTLASHLGEAGNRRLEACFLEHVGDGLIALGDAGGDPLVPGGVGVFAAGVGVNRCDLPLRK